MHESHLSPKKRDRDVIFWSTVGIMNSEGGLFVGEAYFFVFVFFVVSLVPDRGIVYARPFRQFFTLLFFLLC